MKKILYIVLFAIILPISASAGLWQYFHDNGQDLPPVSARASLASDCKISDYVGSAAQNELLLDCALSGKIVGFESTVVTPYQMYTSTSTQIASSTKWMGNLNPQSNNNFDLGVYGLAWQDIKASGTIESPYITSTGLATFLDGFISNASSSVAAGLQVAGAFNASTTLNVGGATDLRSTLGVTGLSTLSNGFISNASSSIGAGLQVAGALNASSTLNVGGNSWLSGTLAAGIGTGYNLGKFYVDSSGNVTASGTVAATGLLATGQPYGVGNITAMFWYNGGSTSVGVYSHQSGNYDSILDFGYAAGTASVTTRWSLQDIRNTSPARFTLKDANSLERIAVLSSNGYVGIGTSTPSEKLTVIGQGAFGNGSATTTISGTATSTFPYGATFATSGGLVGIGTSTPVAKLHINQAPAVGGALAIGFGDDGNTGFNERAEDGLTVTIGGNELFYWDGNEMTSLRGTGSQSAPRIRFVAGNVNIPTYAFQFDADTGMWNPDANLLEFTTFGESRLRIDASGNVGIGTTAPSEKLTVVGNGAFGDGSTTSTITKNSLIIGQTSGYNLGKFYVDSSGNTSASGSVQFAGATVTSGNLTFNSNAAYINTASGSSINFSNNLGNTTGFQVYAATNDISFLTYNATVQARLFIKNDTGNVGIGNTAPTTKLTVSGGDLTIGSNSATTTITGNTIASGIIDGYNLGKFYVDSSGNVNASGTISAVSFAGDGSALTGISSVSSTNYSAFDNLWVGGSATATIKGDSTSTLINGLTISNGALGVGYTDTGTAKVAILGNVGIGKNNPEAALDIRTTGSMTFRLTGAAGARFDLWDEDGNSRNWVMRGSVIQYQDFVLKKSTSAGADPYINGTVMLYIDPSGRLSVGTNTSPLAKLSVDGTLAAVVETGYNLGKFYVDSSGNMTASGTLNGIAINSFEKSFTYTTSTAWSVSTTPALGVAIQAQTWTQASCFTDVGTVYAQFGNGTATTTAFQITTVPSTVTFETALTFTANGRRWVDLGNSASSPKNVSCTVKGSY